MATKFGSVKTSKEELEHALQGMAKFNRSEYQRIARKVWQRIKAQNKT